MMPFMPYLIRAQSVYKNRDMLISSHTHTYTLAHCKYMCLWQWVGRKKRKKTADQYAEEKRWVFSSDLRD